MHLKTCVLSVCMLLMGVCLADAQGPQLNDPNFKGPILVGPENFQDVTPIPGINVDPNQPGPSLGGGAIVVPEVDGVPMAVSDCQCQFYERVCYKDKKHIAPCAETMVVSVIDPCSRKYDCETRCVQVKICVPTCACGCPKVKVSHNGRHTRYDFGKYAVDIFSNRNGTVLVDYDA